MTTTHNSCLLNVIFWRISNSHNVNHHKKIVFNVHARKNHQSIIFCAIISINRIFIWNTLLILFYLEKQWICLSFFLIPHFILHPKITSCYTHKTNVRVKRQGHCFSYIVLRQELKFQITVIIISINAQTYLYRDIYIYMYGHNKCQALNKNRGKYLRIQTNRAIETFNKQLHLKGRINFCCFWLHLI